MGLTGFSKLVILVAPLFLVARLSDARLPDGRLNANMIRRAAAPPISHPAVAAVTSRNGTTLPPYDTVYYFDQLIDHNNPRRGTFKQRYWHSYEYYEPGGPVVIYTPGEANAERYTGYVTNRTIDGLIAQQQNGTLVVLEHRFFGQSNPIPDLSVDSLRLLTVQQGIDDMVYFAQHVNLPMPGGDQLTPDKAPWIWVGSSYSGALVSYAMVTRPDIFFAGYASSAVVEAIVDFWQYFEPIRQYMPQNCSADVQATIAEIDRILVGHNTAEIAALKNTFGMGDVTHSDDFAAALRNNFFDWQSIQPSSGPGGLFYEFCDALEVKNGVNAPASGWGVKHALPAWGAYFKNTYLDILCGSRTAEDCLGTYNASQPYWTDTSVDNENRGWLWLVCNEIGFYQDSPPLGHPAIVSRLLQPAYDQRQCEQMFPGYRTPQYPAVAATNLKYQGWNVHANRLFFANGKRDPWRGSTVSADGLNRHSTPQQPILISDGFHTTDTGTISGVLDPSVAALQKQALKTFAGWLATWKPRK